MGYRHTLTSEHYFAKLGEWFKEKYKDIVYTNEGLISSICERKFYGGIDFFEDYQKALNECDFFDDFGYDVKVVSLSEDGTVTLIEVSKDKIQFFLMTKSYEVDSIK